MKFLSLRPDVPDPQLAAGRVALLLDGGVERDRELEARLRERDRAQAIGEPDGRDGDLAAPEPHLVVDDGERAREVLVVQERLAHAHDHAPRERRERAAARELLEDLVGLEAAREAELPRGAQRASARAAHPRRYA